MPQTNSLSLVAKRTLAFALLGFGLCLVVFVPLLLSIIIGAIYDENFLLIFLLGCGISGVLFVVSLALIMRYLSPKRKLDQIFLGLGLKRKGFGISSFRYVGEWQGRKVQVFFSQGPLLEIYFSTTSKGNIFLRSKTAQQGLRRLVTDQLNIKNLANWDYSADFKAFAADQNWAESRLKQPELKAVTDALLRPVGESLRQSLNLIPQQLVWLNYGNPRIFTYNLKAEEVAAIFQQLVQWLKIIEQQPQPEKIITLSKMEQLYYYSRHALIGKIRLYVGLAFVALTILVTALTLGLIFILDK